MRRSRGDVRWLVFPVMGADLFDLLAENAWSLPTADGMANLHVTELGEGRPIVTLHGGPGAHYDYLVDAVRRHRHRARFILFDQRGSLLSPVPEEKVELLSVEQLIEDLETLRVALGDERLVLLAHSWGSLLAQLYYAAHPDRVAGLILVGAGWPFSLPESGEAEVQERRERLQNRAEVAEALRAAGLDGDPDQLTPRQRSWRDRITGTAALSIYRVENWRRLRTMYWRRDVATAFDRSLPKSWDSRPLLKAHPVAVNVIQGDQDYVDPGATTWVQVSRDHPEVQVTVIDRAGHMPWIDDPDAYDDALAAALTRHLGTTPV